MDSWEDALRNAVRSFNVRVLDERPLCDSCLGRRFASIGRGLTNRYRGSVVRDVLGLDPCDECWLCHGLMDETKEMADAVVKAVEPYQMDNILLGMKVDSSIEVREDELVALLEKDIGESVKLELNREVGKLVTGKLGVSVEYDRPDLVAILDTRFFKVEVQSNPVLFYGRYRKLTRDIPQTRWPCKRCRGKGCDRCGGTGKMYQTSVEEEIRRPTLKAFEARDHRFHGMGREDIDVRMLGNGRPFVFELKEPRIRRVDLQELERTINRESDGIVEVEGLRPASRNEVVAIKEARHDKTYCAKVIFPEPVEREALESACKELVGTVEQRTPKRVSHRRADKIRKRQVYSCTVDGFDGREALVTIHAETGTYIKEILHGDESRTQPSLASLMKTDVTVVWLDVVGIDYP